jgi:Fe-Mn family superoxide dismutase
MSLLTRREMLRWTGAGAAALMMAETSSLLAEEKATGTYPFSLPKLPYAYDALEPSIDARTMMIHHDKHHAGYVANLNKALEGEKSLHKMTVEQLLAGIDKVPEKVRTAVRNNGGGHLNHSWFWAMMSPKGGEPKGALAKAIDKSFGSFAKFQDAFAKAAGTRFGSGWGWLLVKKDGELAVASTANQDNSLMPFPGIPGGRPILGVDVWEHAYYLKYQNRRPDYIKAWWKVVNWPKVAELYASASK